jgi:AcrR family transcriptional regulator
MPPPSKAEANRDADPPTKATRASNRRLEILRRTARLFVERGYETSSMGDVAAANRISKPGLYYHFQSKQDLLAAIIDLAHDQLEGEIERTIAGTSSPSERLRRVVHGHALGITRADDAAFSILAIEEFRSLLPEDRGRITRRKRAYVDFIKSLLDELAAEGGTPAMDTTAAAYTIAGMVLWIPKWYQPGGRLSPEQVAEEITNMVTRSILEPK